MPGAKPKVLLIGWDAADWKIITPLMEAGEMPNLENVVNSGVMGNLATLQPILSPMLWNSISTGFLPDKHGILGFTQVDPLTGKVRPFSTLDRKVKAVWNILSQEGFRTNVVNWFISHPAEPINGVYVSDLFAQSAVNAKSNALAPLPKQTVHPGELSDVLAEFRVAVDEIDSSQIRLFVRRFMEVDQAKDFHLNTLANLLAECFSIHAAATWVMENKPWDFMAACYTSIDHFSHAFMKFHPPRQNHISQRDFDFYHDVVNSVYRLHDVLLGRLLHLAGEETTVILCSDHGYHSDHLRPAIVQHTIAGAAAEHRPVGILAMKGPGIKTDELIHGASIIDITPTILHVFGLPLGNDMAGRPLLDAFTDCAPLKTIPSWEKTKGAAGMLDTRTRIDAADYNALLQQFIALGYMPESNGDDADFAHNTMLENKWNLARVYMDSSRLLRALPLLEEVYEESPLRLEIALQLANCQFRIGLTAEAIEVIENLIAIFPGRPLAKLCRGMLEYERGNAQAALAHFKQLEATQSVSPEFFIQLGHAYFRLNRIDEARRSFAHSLELDPQNPLAHLGETRCLLRLGKNEEAAQSALSALGLNFSLVAAHYFLGLALARMGELEKAAQAFETCLRFSPHYFPAQRCLIHIYSSLPGAGEKAENYRQIYERSSKNRLAPQLHLNEIRRHAELRAAERKLRRAERDKALFETVQGVSQTDSYVPQISKTFVIVSGLPRSGASLMMQMLEAGGIEPLTDRERVADHDNPEGYFEWEAIKEISRKPTLIEQADGKAVKVISMLLPQLPAGHKYKVIFMDRPVEEVAASQSKMLGRKKPLTGAPAEMLSVLHKHREDILQFINRAPEIECCRIHFPSLVTNPEPEIQRLIAFLGDRLVAPEKMKCIVQPQLYRNRTTAGPVAK